MVFAACGVCLAQAESPAAPAGELARYKHSDHVLGTFAEITALAKDRATARKAVEAAYEQIEQVNRLMSDYRPDSEISRLNALPAGGKMVVSPPTFAVLQKAMEVSKRSGGAFDVTCRPLVQLWKQAGQQKKLPDAQQLQQTLAKIGFDKIKLDPATRTVTVTVDGLQIDLGGIAKGYALDVAAQALLDHQAVCGLVDVGGDIRAVGACPAGRPWRIGVRHPFTEGLFAKLAIERGAVATSGDQERFEVINGKRYSHIVDPRTGRPAEQTPSVTVIAPDGITADAWATAFSVLSVKEGQALADQLDGVEVLWIWGSADRPQTAQTQGFPKYISK